MSKAGTASGGPLRSAYDQLAQRPGFQRDRGQERTVEKLEKLRERLIATPREFGHWTRRMLSLLPGRSSIAPVRGLYLWGGVGRGKTMLMDLFYESLPFAERERRHFHRFMRDVHDELRKLKSHEHPLELVAHRLARRARVICFDEFQVSDIADAMILGTLFDGLFRRGVTLVATSNVAPKELYKDGLQRQRFLPTIALLEKEAEVMHIESGTDYRLRSLQQAAIYLEGPPQSHRPQLEELFAAVAGEPGTAGGHLTVEHRRIRCVRQSDDVIWFDFVDLCEGARSQNDYIEIARDFHTVLLSDVPVLNAAHEDAARRFISLVDELYDRNVNLIVSAAAAPAELYRGKKLGFEFQRTASRLVEMQSEEYLSRPHRA
jgi:cell division protein ZapE